MALQRTPLTDFSAGEVSKRLYGRFDLDVYRRGVAKLENWVPDSRGLITTRPSFKYLGETYGNAAARLIPFVVGADNAYVVELTAGAIRIWQGDAVMSLPNPPIAPNDPITTTYTATELPYIQYAKSTNELILVHRNHPIKVLTYEGLRTFSCTDLAISFATDVAAWESAHAYALDDVVVCDDPSASGLPHRIYKCISAGTSGITEPSDEDDVVDGTVTWAYQFTQPFSATDDYPGAVAYFNGRMWYGGSVNHPDTVWASMPYDFGGFDYFDVYSYTGTELKAAADWADPNVPETQTLDYTQTVIGEGSAIEFQLASENDESIMWLCATDHLIVGTGTSEWVVTNDIHALNVEQCVHIRSRKGSYEHQAMVINEKPMFLQGSISKAFLWEYAYNSDSAELQSTNYTYLADHMLEHGVTQMDFASMPQTTWFGVTDGKWACLLLEPEYQVAAWFWTVTDGTILSVCVVPGATDDLVYAVILRNSVYCVERLEEIWGTEPMLDSYVYVASAGAIASGLPRFEGETVWIYNVTHGTMLPCGKVTGAAVAIAAVDQGDPVYLGLPYTCSMESLSLQAGSSATGGTAQGAIKRLSAVTARVLDSYPFKAGYSQTEHLELAKTADDSPWLDAYSGDVRIPFQGKWSREGKLWIVQDKPQKTTIVALFPEVDA